MTEMLVRSKGGGLQRSANLAKTHCPAGHEYSPENTYTKVLQSGSRKGTVQRVCRACARDRRTLVRLQERYGLSREQYLAMYAEQSGRCKACQAPLTLGSRQTHVDHCHATGKVRGLLCHLCNMALGLVQDNPDRLRALISYLEDAR